MSYTCQLGEVRVAASLTGRPARPLVKQKPRSGFCLTGWRLGERGGLGAPRTELSPVVKGSRRPWVSTPTDISLNRLLSDVYTGVIRLFFRFAYSFIRTHITQKNHHLI